ncbi:class I SAM-dependent DNA methyltransferase [Caldalkalibacillus salinus]|uniref:class I SAM-dependent DNA methyltransferase n=1 Tax=Caldalkalibacillus salinus TaxID=2803787 RepID=UPI001922304B|nr:class I SAM-dependent methyltransferase [Caldalkalibacillus salinus]
MKNDFNELFDQWAPVYDQTVHDTTGEYQEVFEGYEDILSRVVAEIPAGGSRVLEFGVGTGNLSEKIREQGYELIGVEPSAEMRRKVTEKGIPIDLREGSFLDIPLQKNEKVDAIVSTYAFHHLTLKEKETSLSKMKAFLKPGGVIVFADTVYQNENTKQDILTRVKAQDKPNLLKDLQTEYYETIDDLRTEFERNGFSVTFDRLNRFVWLIKAY